MIAAATAAAIFLSVSHAAEPDKPGLPDLQHPFTDLTPAAQLKLGGTADWVDVTPSSVWIGAGSDNAVHAIDPKPAPACPRRTAPYGFRSAVPTAHAAWPGSIFKAVR